MKVVLTPQDLIEYEEKIIQLFNDKKIRSPIHLDNGNEEQLIKIFNDYVNEDDWVMGSWRTHYKCLLKGVPQGQLTQAILDNHSISLCFPEHKVIASAIVGGIVPIAIGTAMAIKSSKQKVVCFVGDMTSESGIFHEAVKYAQNHDLPIIFVIEDNGKSVCTSTKEVWNTSKLTYEPKDYVEKTVIEVATKVLYFKYSSKFPHAGGGARIQF